MSKGLLLLGQLVVVLGRRAEDLQPAAVRAARLLAPPAVARYVAGLDARCPGEVVGGARGAGRVRLLPSGAWHALGCRQAAGADVRLVALRLEEREVYELEEEALLTMLCYATTTTREVYELEE